MKKVLLCSLALLLFVGCGKKTETKKEENNDAIKFKEEYESLNGKEDYLEVSIKEKNPITYSSIDEIIDVIDNKSGLIYLGSPESNSCRDNIPVLLEAVYQVGLKNIYYYDIRNINSDTKTKEKLERIKEYVNDFDGFNIIFVKDKDTIKTASSLDKDYIKMNEDEKDSLLKQYRNSIHEMLDDLCDESC